MATKQTLSLEGLIQSKGAPRPADMPQRGEGPAAPPEPAPAAKPVPPRANAVEPRTKSLTLRLSEAQYQRLRRFAFDQGTSHQDVIEVALMKHLDSEGG